MTWRTTYREIKKIVVTEEKDGAFAVVDIDTLWIEKKSGKLKPLERQGVQGVCQGRE